MRTPRQWHRTHKEAEHSPSQTFESWLGEDQNSLGWIQCSSLFEQQFGLENSWFLLFFSAEIILWSCDLMRSVVNLCTAAIYFQKTLFSLLHLLVPLFFIPFAIKWCCAAMPIWVVRITTAWQSVCRIGEWLRLDWNLSSINTKTAIIFFSTVRMYTELYRAWCSCKCIHLWEGNDSSVDFENRSDDWVDFWR